VGSPERVDYGFSPIRFFQINHGMYIRLLLLIYMSSSYGEVIVLARQMRALVYMSHILESGRYCVQLNCSDYR